MVAERANAGLLVPGECYLCSRAPERVEGVVGYWPHEDSEVASWMLAPRRHVVNFDDATPEEVLAIHRGVAAVSTEWREADPETGLNVVWNLGRVAGQTVNHLHCHILRRTQTGPLPGLGPRWWLKNDLRGRPLLNALGRLNRRNYGKR